MPRLGLFASLSFLVAACVVIPLDDVRDDQAQLPISCSGFRCSNGGCVPQSYRCDTDRDCSDGSDELGCPVNMSCSGFSCTSGGCVPTSYKCDGDRDCSDGSDEQNCPLPDLVVTSFLLQPLTGAEPFRYLCLNQNPNGTAASFGNSVVVSNQGSAAAGQYYVRLGLQNEVSGQVYLLDGSLVSDSGDHAAGTTRTWYGPICAVRDVSDLPVGSYKAVVWADYDEDVRESSETNNVTYAASSSVYVSATTPAGCTDTCQYANDDFCDDPGDCAPGTDCTDCEAGSACNNTCQYAIDGVCDDPGDCASGTDCFDCEN